MFIVHLLPFPFRGVVAPYLWIFYKAIDKLGTDAVYFISADYLIDPQEFLIMGRPELSEASMLDLNYSVPDKGMLDKLSVEIVPQELMNKFLEKCGMNLNRAWRTFLTEEDHELTAWYKSAIKHIIDRQINIEAIITWCNCPSLTAAAHFYSIPVVHCEVGPLRKPNYLHTTYFDFSGVNGNTECKKRYEDWNAKGACVALTPAELRSIFCAAPIPTSETSYALGVPLQVEDDSNIIAFSNGSDNQSLINYARFLVTDDQILVRSHPGSQFIYKGTILDKDDSPTTAHFLSKCNQVLTINSSVGVEALLYGKKVLCLGEAPYAYITEVEPDSDEFNRRLTFFLLNYLVPEKFLFDREYIRWRLTRPSEELIRERHMIELNRAKLEMKIAALNQSLAERDSQIAALNQAVTERDAKIAALNQSLAERDDLVNEIFASRSWRMTKLLRWVGRVLRRGSSV